jgi:hypothetical protein
MGNEVACGPDMPSTKRANPYTHVGPSPGSEFSTRLWYISTRLYVNFWHFWTIDALGCTDMARAAGRVMRTGGTRNVPPDFRLHTFRIRYISPKLSPLRACSRLPPFTLRMTLPACLEMMGTFTTSFDVGHGNVNQMTVVSTVHGRMRERERERKLHLFQPPRAD